MKFMVSIFRNGQYKGMGIARIVDDDGCVLSASTQPMGDEELRASLRVLKVNPAFPFTDEEKAQLWDERGEPIIWTS